MIRFQRRLVRPPRRVLRQSLDQFQVLLLICDGFLVTDTRLA